MKTAELPTKLFITVTYLVMVATNYLANALPLNGIETGEVSDSYPNLFAPAGITFSIWGVIYLLLAVHILYQWGLFHDANSRRGELLNRIGMLFGISSLANTAWVFAWHYDQILISTLLIIAILVLLSMIVGTLRDAGLDRREYWFIRLPFSVYLGWITVATVANITTWLVSIGFDGFGIAESIWAMVIIAVAAAIGMFKMLRNRDIAYGVVLIWAYIGIFIKHTSADGWAGRFPEVITTIVVCLVAFLIAELLVWRRKTA